jgi:plasmid replication initiation protein
MGKAVTHMGLPKQESERELKKHAATIHCSNTLSLLQRKISNALLYHSYKELMLKEEHEITVKQLCRLIGYQGNNHAVIKEAMKGLLSTIIEWNLINDQTGTENWTASSMIASVSLQGPLCYYAYSPRMKQLLHSPSMFGKIDLVIQSRFRSSYGLALYENCIRYRGLPYTKWFDMEMFKKLMGVPVGMYDIFRDFKRRVLDKAVNEVNSYSDLMIASECTREGRKVVRVRFKLQERVKKMSAACKSLENLPQKITTHPLKTKLEQVFELSEIQIKQILAEYSVEFIEEKIAVIEASKPYQENKIKNLAGYLITALKKDYKLSKRRVLGLTPIKANKQHFESLEVKREVEDIRQSYEVYRERMIQEAISSLGPKEKSRFRAQFRRSAALAIKSVLELQHSKYSRRSVIDSPQIQALLRQFALRKLDFPLISLQEFVSGLGEKQQKAWQIIKSQEGEVVE